MPRLRSRHPTSNSTKKGPNHEKLNKKHIIAAKKLLLSVSNDLEGADKENAPPIFKKLAAKLETATSTLIIAHTYKNVAILLYNRKMHPQAARLLRNAVKIYESYGAHDQVLKCKTIQAKCLISEARTQYSTFPSKSIEFLSEAIHLLRNLGSKPLDLAAAYIWRGLSQIAVQNGIPDNKDITKAFSDLDIGIEICSNNASEQGKLASMIKPLTLVSGLFRFLGLYDKQATVLLILAEAHKPMNCDNQCLHAHILLALGNAQMHSSIDRNHPQSHIKGGKEILARLRRSKAPVCGSSSNQSHAAALVIAASIQTNSGSMSTGKDIAARTAHEIEKARSNEHIRLSAKDILSLMGAYRELARGLWIGASCGYHLVKAVVQMERGVKLARTLRPLMENFRGRTEFGYSNFEIRLEILLTLEICGRMWEVLGDCLRARHYLQKAAELAHGTVWPGSRINLRQARVARRMGRLNDSWNFLKAAKCKLDTNGVRSKITNLLDVEYSLQEGSLQAQSSNSDMECLKTALEIFKTARKLALTVTTKSEDQLPRLRSLSRLVSISCIGDPDSLVMAEDKQKWTSEFQKILGAQSKDETIQIIKSVELEALAQVAKMLYECALTSERSVALLRRSLDISLSFGLSTASKSALQFLCGGSSVMPQVLHLRAPASCIASNTQRSSKSRVRKRRGRNLSISSLADELSAVDLKSNSISTSSSTAVHIVHATQGMLTRHHSHIVAEQRVHDKRKIEISLGTSAAEESDFKFVGISGEIKRMEQLRQEILPKEWTVCSISSSNDGNGLVLTRMSGGQHPASFPIAIRIGYDAKDGNPVTQFQKELKEILDKSNDLNRRAKISGRHSMARDSKRKWWAEKRRLDRQLEVLTKDLETRLFGPARCITSGNFRNEKLQKRLDQSSVDLAETLAASPFLLDIPSSLCALMLITRSLTLEDVTSLLNSYTIEGTDHSRVARVIIKQNKLFWKGLDDEEREPVVLVVGKGLDEIPWESSAGLRGRAVTRVPCLHLFYRNLKFHKSRRLNWRRGFYVLNPEEDLIATQDIFEKKFTNEKGWRGICGKAPSREEYRDGLCDHDIFIYCGHSNGSKYLPGWEVREHKVRAVTLLMGCSSGHLQTPGLYEAQGIANDYLVSGCPSLVANLWDVTDKDIDRFCAALLKCLRDGMSVTSAVAAARSHCKLPFLNGASPICYGLPNLNFASYDEDVSPSSRDRGTRNDLLNTDQDARFDR